MNAPRRRSSMPLWHLAVLAALYMPCVVAFEPVFGGGAGLRAAGGGVTAGLLIALGAGLFRWDVLTTTAVGVVIYLLGSGVAALPQTTIAGMLPSWTTIQLTAVETVTSWKDVLTLSPPESAYTGPTVMPWLAGLVCSLVSGVLVTRRGAYVAATIPLVLFATVGIAWGMEGQQPPVWPALLWMVCTCAWWAWCGHQKRVTAGLDVVVGRTAVNSAIADSLSEGTTTEHVGVVRPLRRIGTLTLTLLIAGVLAGQLAPLWTATLPRAVLREAVEPPFVLQDYPTPLAAFRHDETDLADQPLIDVTGLPNEARVRIAAMDSYDGVVFSMAGVDDATDGGFVHVGRVLRTDEGAGDQTHVTMTTHGLIGPWVPTVGSPYELGFQGDDANSLGNGLYINRDLDTVLTTAGMAGDHTYTLDTRVQPVSTEGQLRTARTPPLTGKPDTGVPPRVAELAHEVTAGSQTPYESVAGIAQYLSKNGFFANQNETRSQPGHRADRLERMLAGDQMIGDDEQYAALMALMVRSLDMPARVVMGLYPSTWPSDGAAITLRGRDMHVWVEVEFDDVGWVTFDPTPPRDQVPKTETKLPKSVPVPQILPPPDPPKDPVELPPSVVDRPDSDPPPQSVEIPWVAIGLSGLGLLVIAGPLLAIVLAKALRRRRRLHAPAPSVAVRGAWDDIVDLAVDAGTSPPVNLTRQETAIVLTQSVWEASPRSEMPPRDHQGGLDQTPVPDGNPVLTLANFVDRAMFSGLPVTPADVDAAWSHARGLRLDARAQAGWWARVRRTLSLRSFRWRRSLGRAAQRRKGTW